LLLLLNARLELLCCSLEEEISKELLLSTRLELLVPTESIEEELPVLEQLAYICSTSAGVGNSGDWFEQEISRTSTVPAMKIETLRDFIIINCEYTKIIHESLYFLRNIK